jgi:hypothetical protein
MDLVVRGGKKIPAHPPFFKTKLKLGVFLFFFTETKPIKCILYSATPFLNNVDIGIFLSMLCLIACSIFGI